MRLLRYLAFPIALVYAAAVTLRNLLYSYRILPSKDFRTPVLSVGNLQLGGTGKTPMIEWIISQLKDHRNLAVVSRGYKRKSKGMVEAGEESNADTIGDEPMQLYTKFPDIKLILDADRTRAIQYLEHTYKPDLILLDDAHQHRKVIPELSLILTVYKDLYVGDWWLPTGNLRDNKSAARRAHFIVVTKCPDHLSSSEMEEIKIRLNAKESQRVLFCSLRYSEMLRGPKGELAINGLEGREFTLVTGIAKPQQMVMYLKSKGLEFTHLSFPDHHEFSDREIEILKQKELIITTAKDAVRLANRLNNYYVLEVAHEFLGNGAEILMEKVRTL